MLLFWGTSSLAFLVLRLTLTVCPCEFSVFIHLFSIYFCLVLRQIHSIDWSKWITGTGQYQVNHWYHWLSFISFQQDCSIFHPPTLSALSPPLKCPALSFTSLPLFGHPWHLAQTCPPLSVMTSTDYISVRNLWVGGNHKAGRSHVQLVLWNILKISCDWSVPVEKKNIDGPKYNNNELCLTFSVTKTSSCSSWQCLVDKVKYLLGLFIPPDRKASTSSL